MGSWYSGVLRYMYNIIQYPGFKDSAEYSRLDSVALQRPISFDISNFSSARSVVGLFDRTIPIAHRYR